MKTLLCLALLASVAAETGCTAVKAYHLDHPVTLLPNNISLAYIEFDDNGEMYDQHLTSDPASPLVRPELDQTIQRIQDLQAGSTAGVNVVVFIHGWKNNADNTSNVAGFRDFLNEVYSFYSGSSSGPPASTRPLMGIYIGWRGESLEVAQDLTYFTRSAATLRVAGPHLEEALYRIIRTVKTVPRGATSTSPSTLIVIGHSFGGRILERVMTPYFEQKMLSLDGDHLQGCAAGSVNINDTSRWRITDPLPDLTVLLNEAAPATDAKQFLEFLKCHAVAYSRQDPGYQSQDVNYPLFLSITSDGDAATSIALPLGQAVGSLPLRTRNYSAPDPPEIPSQITYFTHSTANIPALNSHEVRASSDTCAAHGETEVHLAQANPAGYHFCTVPTTKVAGEPYWNHTPYWVAKIPVAIVPDHSNIFRPELYKFLEFFLPSPETLSGRSRSEQRVSGK
ncbi:MAG TPA: hypothetical protein VGG72_06450 [Bryobacteraceae bacterium]|jgi:pimeloyl-ACP methyl ester carboxylesterase